jgi:hypothetical protein
MNPHRTLNEGPAVPESNPELLGLLLRRVDSLEARALDCVTTQPERAEFLVQLATRLRAIAQSTPTA